MPFFSIIIPTYNRANLIAKTIDTVLQQSFTDFEVLIVDDGSGDNTESVVKTFTDPRIQYFKKQNGERGAARNFGASRAKGVYFNFFDSDDLLYPSHLSTAFEFAHEKGKPEFFHLAYDYKSADGELLKCVTDFDEKTRHFLLFDNRLSCNGVFLRGDIARQFPFEENRALASSEDWELWIRLVSRFTLHFSNDVTSSVISHDQRSLRTIPVEKIVERDLLLIEKLKNDPVVMRHYRNGFKRFMAERYTFFMLNFAEQKNRQEVFRWAKRAFAIYPVILFSRRFLASIKNSIRS